MTRFSYGRRRAEGRRGRRGHDGAGVAQTFAAAGYPVRLQDIADAAVGRGMGAMKKSLERLVARGKLAAADRDATLERISPTTRIDDLADCDVVVEAVLERFDIKKAVIADLDRVCRKETILATNTSSISVTRIASTSKVPGRVIGMHFFNPVPIMQLVEIIRALQTTDATTAKITALTEAIGKKARVSKDSNGFVVNRVLAPMINEAINCVHEGLASPDDVDQMMKLGANHPMGPLSLADLIGLDIVLDIMETLYNGFDDFEVPAEPVAETDVRCGLSRPQDGQGLLHLRGGGLKRRPKLFLSAAHSGCSAACSGRARIASLPLPDAIDAVLMRAVDRRGFESLRQVKIAQCQQRLGSGWRIWSFSFAYLVFTWWPPGIASVSNARDAVILAASGHAHSIRRFDRAAGSSCRSETRSRRRPLPPWRRRTDFGRRRGPRSCVISFPENGETMVRRPSSRARRSTGDKRGAPSTRPIALTTGCRPRSRIARHFCSRGE